MTQEQREELEQITREQLEIYEQVRDRLMDESNNIKYQLDIAKAKKKDDEIVNNQWMARAKHALRKKSAQHQEVVREISMLKKQIVRRDALSRDKRLIEILREIVGEELFFQACSTLDHQENKRVENESIKQREIK